MDYRKLRRVHAERRTPDEIGADIDEEIAFHLESRITALMADGHSRTEAERQAMQEFGDVGTLRHSLQRRDEGMQRRLRLLVWAEELLQDTRFALRGFRRTPGFAAVAIATLALGIGATAAIFTLVNAVVLRPLPYPTADRLMQVAPGMNFNVALSREVADGSPWIEAASGISLWNLTLTGHGDAARMTAQATSADFFDVLGVRPALGRAYRHDEQEPATSGVVLLSWDVWQTRFGGDPGIIGQVISLDGGRHARREVIGVMPKGFIAPMTPRPEQVAFWVPLSLPAGRTVVTDSTWYVNQVIALARPGTVAAAATNELRGLLGRLHEEHGPSVDSNWVQQAVVMPLQESIVGDTRRTLLMLQGAVALVLLLACANLANLLLARGDRRRQELAARAALGGTRARLIREMLTEAGLLATFGAGAGLLLASVLLRLLSVAEGSGLPRAAELSIDARVVAFTILVSCIALAVFALVPALRATRGDLRPDVAAAGRTLGSTRAGRRTGALLIATEVALALMLVTGSGLLIRSVRTLRSVDPGMNTAGVLSIEVTLPPAEYTGDRAVMFFTELVTQLRELPGVTSAGAIHLLPFTGSNWAFPYLAEGQTPVSGQPLPVANFRIATPGYFETVGMQLLAGESFSAQHAAGGSDLIINRSMAEQLWPGSDAVGREVLVFGNMPLRVIGVVNDVHQHALDEAPRPEMYRPLTQWSNTALYVMLRTDGEPATYADAARRLIAGMDPNVPVHAQPLVDVLDDSMQQRRFFANALALFGAMALLLGAIGVYGVMSYAITARMPEFSVRMALGASTAEVLLMAIRSAMVPVLFGLAGGVAGALATTRLLQTLLFGVQPDDTATIAASAAVLVGISLLASWLPARRATRAEPMRVLRG